MNTHWKDWCWSCSSKTLATWCEEPSHWERPWSWERSKAEGEGNDRGWDGWMASPTQWTWTWANSGRQWGTWKPGVLQSMGSQSRTWFGDWTTNKRSKLSRRQSHFPTEPFSTFNWTILSLVGNIPPLGLLLLLLLSHFSRVRLCGTP